MEVSSVAVFHVWLSINYDVTSLWNSVLFIQHDNCWLHGGVLTRFIASPPVFPWLRVWIQQPEERLFSRCGGEWAYNGASSECFPFKSFRKVSLWWVWPVKAVLLHTSSSSSCHLSSLRGPRQALHFFFSFFWESLLGGMSCICLVGCLEGGHGLGLSVQRLGKLAPESKDVQLIPSRSRQSLPVMNRFAVYQSVAHLGNKWTLRFTKWIKTADDLLFCH